MIHLEFYHTCRLWNRNQTLFFNPRWQFRYPPTPTSYWVTHISPLVGNPTFTIILNVLCVLESLGSCSVLWFIGLSPCTCSAVWIVTTSWSLIMSADFDSPIMLLRVFLVILTYLFFTFPVQTLVPAPKLCCDSPQDLLILGPASGRSRVLLLVWVLLPGVAVTPVMPSSSLLWCRLVCSSHISCPSSWIWEAAASVYIFLKPYCLLYIYNFIYLFILAMLGLRCCMGFSLSCSKPGLFSSWGAWTSFWGCSSLHTHSYCRAQAPGLTGFSSWAPGF